MNYRGRRKNSGSYFYFCAGPHKETILLTQKCGLASKKSQNDFL